MKENFVICIESLHLPDKGHQDNVSGAKGNAGTCRTHVSCFLSLQVHELSGDKLKQRDVVFIDIANDPVSVNDYKEDEDPTKFKSVKTGRGPLVGRDWKDKVDPVMTCYKLVTVEFKWFGLQVSARRCLVCMCRLQFVLVASWRSFSRMCVVNVFLCRVTSM